MTRSGRGSLVITINLRQLRTGVQEPDNLRPGVGLSLLPSVAFDHFCERVPAYYIISVELAQSTPGASTLYIARSTPS
jgi:hypothetical protein